MTQLPLSPGEQRALYRRLVTHPQWLAYVGDWGVFHLRGPQDTWVTLFSSEADLSLAESEAGEPIDTVKMAGFEPFALHLGARSGVAIDPASPGAIHFKKPQLPHLEAWGRGSWIERLLRHSRHEPWVATQLVRHPCYWVLAQGEGSAGAWLRAKAQRGRQGFALFVLEDAAYRFIERERLEMATLRLVRFTGEVLFKALTREVNAMDVVLNPAGPGPSHHIPGSELARWLKAAQ